MERLRQKLYVATCAVQTLHEALQLTQPSILERDGTIQRFEYAFETLWKAAQHYLETIEGLPCHSPKSCFRLLGQVGILSEEQIILALVMTDDRNLTVHTYNEPLADAIFRRLPGYLEISQPILRQMSAHT